MSGLEFRKMSQVRRPIIIGEFPEVTTMILEHVEDWRRYMTNLTNDINIKSNVSMLLSF